MEREFELLNEYRPGHFGNFAYDYGSKEMNVRVYSDKSVLGIDIQSPLDTDRWFDLDVVREFILQNNKLIEPVPFESKVSFFIDHFKLIRNLFAGDHYSETRDSLDTLQQKRARLLFPQLFQQ